MQMPTTAVILCSLPTRDHLWNAEEGRHGSDEENVAATPLDHFRQDGAAHRERACYVCVVDLAGLIVCGLTPALFRCYIVQYIRSRGSARGRRIAKHAFASSGYHYASPGRNKRGSDRKADAGSASGDKRHVATEAESIQRKRGTPIRGFHIF